MPEKVKNIAEEKPGRQREVERSERHEEIKSRIQWGRHLFLRL
jgi:hypothetical protein